MPIATSQLEGAFNAARSSAFAVANSEIARQFGADYESYRKASIVVRYALEEFADTIEEQLGAPYSV